MENRFNLYFNIIHALLTALQVNYLVKERKNGIPGTD